MRKIIRYSIKGFAIRFLIFLISVSVFLLIREIYLERKTVAVVNNDRIYYSELNKKLQNIYGKVVLERMLEEKLVLQSNEKHKIKISDKKINEEYENLVKSFPSKQDFEKMLEESKLTEKDVKEQLRIGRILSEISAKDKVKEDEMKKFFEKNKERFAEPERVRVKHILTEDVKEAETVLEKLRDGEDFNELAKKHSIDEMSKDFGGDLGFLSRGQVPNLPREVEDEIFSLKVDEYSDIIGTNLGHHIFKVKERIPKRLRGYDEVKDEVKEYVRQPVGWLEIAKMRAKIINKLKVEK